MKNRIQYNEIMLRLKNAVSGLSRFTGRRSGRVVIIYLTIVDGDIISEEGIHIGHTTTGDSSPIVGNITVMHKFDK